MIESAADQRTLRAALADAHRAATEFDDARAWLARALKGQMDPIAAEVWAFDEAFEHILLVKHRWRGWVPPGGMVESGETPREAACRELLEETGIIADVLDVPAAVTVRSYRSDWTATLGLSYAAVVDGSLPLTEEDRQPAAWIPLDHDWEGAFPEDRPRIRAYAGQLSRTRTGTDRWDPPSAASPRR
ncbi:NUDIX hydrolase [Microbispora bryophytorum]|uniref:NUDIX hydrolase n=1 Tax=Microbispora bryophytorum TaxID=1460882 RepID=UPI0033E67B66